MQDQLDALESIITQLVQRADNLHQANEQLKQQLARTQDELAKSRHMLEDTGIRIDLLIDQLKQDTNIEPIADDEAGTDADVSPASITEPAA